MIGQNEWEDTMPQKKKTSRPRESPAERKLQALGKKWVKAMESQAKFAESHMTLAQQLFDIAVERDDAELLIFDRPSDKPRAKPTVIKYKLTDPRAALWTMFRFCNIWLPLGQWICLQRGCPPWNPPGAPPGKYCFLIGCFVNVCPSPGAARTRCVYLCL